jgi:hypothetical protein
MGILTVNSIIPTLVGISSGGNITNTASGFNSTERQTLVSGTYQEILTNLTNQINTLVTTWVSKLMAITAMTNADDRTPQSSQNTTTFANVASTQSSLATWQALSPTGASGKYTAAEIALITTQITSRGSQITARLPQITTALGGTASAALSQSGENFSTSVPNNPYYNRFNWVNFRINRISGSLRRYYATMQSSGTVASLLGNNTAISSQYNGYFLTKQVTFVDGSAILHLKDLTGLSNGDMLTVVSDTQPEISRTILQLMGTTQVQLSAPVPTTYTLADTARVFKTL